MLGVLWMFSGPSTGDVMGGSEMWPFMAVGGCVLGIGHGALYGILRHTVNPFNVTVTGASNKRRRMIAGAYGAAAGGLPWLLFQPALAAFLAGLGFITAAAFPGSGYAADR